MELKIVGSAENHGIPYLTGYWRMWRRVGYVWPSVI